MLLRIFVLLLFLTNGGMIKPIDIFVTGTASLSLSPLWKYTQVTHSLSLLDSQKTGVTLSLSLARCDHVDFDWERERETLSNSQNPHGRSISLSLSQNCQNTSFFLSPSPLSLYYPKN